MPKVQVPIAQEHGLFVNSWDPGGQNLSILSSLAPKGHVTTLATASHNLHSKIHCS